MASPEAKCFCINAAFLDFVKNRGVWGPWRFLMNAEARIKNALIAERMKRWLSAERHGLRESDVS